MATPFLGEIKIVSFGFAPKGWAQCNGQAMAIGQNQALYSLLGTAFGGDGRTFFNLPNLGASVPVHMGLGTTIGESGGESSHTLNKSELPQHTHGAMASPSDGDAPVPQDRVLARSVNNPYANLDNQVTLHPQTIASSGGSQAHENRQPYLALTFCIAIQGIFPSRN